MSCLRSALRRYIKNSSILSPNDVPFRLQRCHNFNILDLSRQTHTCVTNGVAENLRCSLSKSHFGKLKAITSAFSSISVQQYSSHSKPNSNQYQPKPSNDRRRIVLLGLSISTTKESINAHFAKFGTVTDSGIRGKRHSGIWGFVEFESEDQVDRALSSLPHDIDVYSRGITEVSQCLPNNQRKMKLQIRVLDLSPKTTDESLREFYSKFGGLTQCEVRKDPKSGQSNGCGYVTFTTKNGLDCALDAEPHVIDGTEVFLQYVTGEMDLWIPRVPDGITQEMLQGFFSQFGEVRDIRPLSLKNQPGHVYVCFSSLDEANRALEARPHIIDGKVLQTKSGDKFNVRSFSLFVGSLPRNVTEKSLIEAFSKFGKIVHWGLFKDTRSLVELQQDRPFAFISYANPKEALRARNNGAHAIDGEVLDLIVGEAMDSLGKRINKYTNKRSKQSSSSLIIPFLPENMTEKSLTEVFSKFGVLTSLDLVNDERPYAIVSYATQEDALKAFDNNPHTVEGKPVRALKVSEMSSKMRKKFNICLDESKDKKEVSGILGFESIMCGIPASPPWDTSRVTTGASNLGMSCLRSALRRYIKNSSILSPNDIPFRLQRCHNFNILDISRQIHTCFKNGVAENQRCSLSKSHFGKLKAITVASSSISAQHYSIQFNKFYDQFLPNSSNDRRLIVLLGLSKFTTKESINEYFAKFGPITDSGIGGKRHSGISGFVEFESEEQANAAAKFFPHEIDDREVSVVRYLDDKLNKHKIFVGGLHPRHTPNASVREFYSQFGEIISCYVGGDTGHKYAIIGFDSQEAVDRALTSLPHCIDKYNYEITDAHQNFPNNQRKMNLQMRVLDLSPKTTDESLREFYSKFGDLRQCEVKKNPKSGESDLYGYVTFATKQGLNRALAAEPHVIDGTKVFFQYCTGEMDLCIYRVPEGITEETLQEFFSQFGQVRSVRSNPLLNEPGHVYVCFSSKAAANRALEARPHIIQKNVLDTRSGDKHNLRSFPLTVGSIPENVSEKSILEAFSKFGKIVHWELFNNRSYLVESRNRQPFAIITYGTSEEALEALKNGPDAISGADLSVKKGVIKNLGRTKSSYINRRSKQGSCPLFIPLLPENVTAESLTEVFSKFGELTTLDLVNDERLIRNGKKTPPYAIVSFATQEDALKAFDNNPHTVEGTPVRALKADRISTTMKTRFNIFLDENKD
ncbi:RNA recognition motif domain-containing protein [Ditylenchus destructor]|nr:RNA recognition motif domain-containing protein [Ditylenchus destructor]